MDDQSHFMALDEELSLIIALPSNVDGRFLISDDDSEESSDVNGKFFSRKENEHNYVLDQMKRSFKDVDGRITEEIWSESKILQSYLIKMKEDIEGWFDKNIRGFLDKLLELKMTVFSTARTEIKYYESNRSELIDTFYQTLKNIEKKRSNLFKVILNDFYKKLQRVSFKLPNELLEFFEREILNINVVTLDNYRHYLDLYTGLKLQTEDHTRLLLLELRDVENKHRLTVKKVTVRGMVDMKVFSYEDIFHTDSFDEQEKIQVIAKFSKVTSVPSADHFPVSTADIEVWSRQIQETLDILDGSAKKLVDLYKVAVMDIFNRFFHKLQKVTDMLTEEQSSESIQDNYSHTEVFKPIIDDMTQQYACEVADLQNLWNSLTTYMQSNIKSTYMFLDGSSHLWDAHFDRMTDIQNLTLQDLKNTIDKNDKTAQDFEKKVNKTVDLLRQSSTVQKLNQYLTETNKFLDSMAELCSKQCDEEINVLKKYYGLIGEEIDLLLVEIGRFLEEFSQEKKKYQEKTTTKNADGLNENLIPHQMKTCKYQVDAVNNWMLGLWEAIKTYMTTCRKELMDEAVQWVEKQVTKLKKRLEVRMAMHQPRYAKIKHLVYDVRLVELEDHLRIVDGIDEAIDARIVSSRSLIRECREKQLTVFDEYDMFVSETEEKMRSSKRSLQILSLMEGTNEFGKRTKERLEDGFQENIEQIEENMKGIKQRIDDVSCSIKLFSDGGNYSQEEVKVFIKRIGKANKALPKKFSKMFEEAQAVKAEILDRVRVAQADFLARLDSSKREMEHNETAILKIRTLRNDIHRKVHAVKYRLMRIEACVEYFTVMSKIDLWKRKNFEIMKTSLVECLERMTELTEYLSKDYICELMNLIDISIEEIAAASQVFYQEHGPIVNEGRIQPSYDAFMEEISRNYEGYRRQVKINSLECSQELISHILRLLKVNDGVYEDLAERYPQMMEDKSGDHDRYRELCEKLSKKSLDLQEGREFLQREEENTEEEKENDDVNPVIKDIVQEYSGRVSLLHSLINRLFDHVKEKLDAMEKVLEEEDLNINENVKKT